MTTKAIRCAKVTWLLLCGAVCVSSPVDVIPTCPTECICLSHTQVICNSASIRGVPSALHNSITHLSLSRADIRILYSDAFSHLRHLTKIILDGCNLTKIKPFAFRSLPRLRQIYIQNTPLTTINAFAFAALQNITEIILTHNRITQIEGYAFAGTNNIKLISLRNNPLRRILAHAFSGLTDVDQIELPSGIKWIEPLSFIGLEGVGDLELVNMDLKTILTDTFKGLIKIRRLVLRESDLGVIQSGAFDGLQKVDLLEITNNKIDRIDELLLVYNNSIETFKFSGNHMLENPDSVLLEVTKIVIKDNHLPCDCKHDVLVNPLAISDSFDTENFCISPLSVGGRTIAAFIAECRGDKVGNAVARAAAGAKKTWDFYSHQQMSLFAALILVYINR